VHLTDNGTEHNFWEEKRTPKKKERGDTKKLGVWSASGSIWGDTRKRRSRAREPQNAGRLRKKKNTAGSCDTGTERVARMKGTQQKQYRTHPTPKPTNKSKSPTSCQNERKPSPVTGEC